MPALHENILLREFAPIPKRPKREQHNGGYLQHSKVYEGKMPSIQIARNIIVIGRSGSSASCARLLYKAHKTVERPR